MNNDAIEVDAEHDRDIEIIAAFLTVVDKPGLQVALSKILGKIRRTKKIDDKKTNLILESFKAINIGVSKVIEKYEITAREVKTFEYIFSQASSQYNRSSFYDLIGPSLIAGSASVLSAFIFYDQFFRGDDSDELMLTLKSIFQGFVLALAAIVATATFFSNFRRAKFMARSEEKKILVNQLKYIREEMEERL